MILVSVGLRIRMGNYWFMRWTSTSLGSYLNPKLHQFVTRPLALARLVCSASCVVSADAAGFSDVRAVTWQYCVLVYLVLLQVECWLLQVNSQGADIHG